MPFGEARAARQVLGVSRVFEILEYSVIPRNKEGFSCSANRPASLELASALARGSPEDGSRD